MFDSMYRHFVIALVLALVLSLAGGAWFYRDQAERWRAEVEDDLQSIADLKAQQIETWRRERLGDAGVLTESPFMGMQVARWFAAPDSRGEERIRQRFEGLRDNIGYSNVMLVDARGEVRLSLGGGTGQLDGEAMSVFEAAIRSGEPSMTDLHLGALHQTVHSAAIAPLFNPDSQPPEPIGAIVLITDADKFLYPLIQTWPTRSKTAETLLVRRDGDNVLFLSRLRHRPDSALKLRIPIDRADLPSAMAVRGVQGVVHGVDYRGAEVVAVLRPITGTPWFMIAKEDASEIYAGWRRQSALMLALLLGVAAVVLVTLTSLRQRQSKAHYRALYRAETERHASEERHGVTLRSIGDGVITTDKEGRVELLNPVAESLCGWSTEEARGKKLEDVFVIVNEETRAPVESPVPRVLREGHVVGLANHTVLIARDRTERPIADSGAPIHDSDGAITGVVLVFRDRTEERAAHRALVDAEGFQRTLLESISETILITDHESRVLRAYGGGARLFEERVEGELGGKRIEELLGQLPFPLDTLRGEGKVRNFEAVVTARDGARRHLLISAKRVMLGEDSFLFTCRDFTERRRAEEDYAALFRQMLSGFAIHKMIYDERGEAVDYRFLHVNPAFRRLTKLGDMEIEGRTARELFPDIGPDLIRVYGRVAAGGGPEHLTQYFAPLDRYFEITAFCPEVGQFACAFEDVTERFRVQEEARRNEDRLRSVVEILQSQAPTTQEFLDLALEKALALTESALGYIYFYHSESKEFTINTWSKDVMRECSVANPPARYELGKTGIWGEAVRQRKPIILNDFQAEHPLKKGYPEGHARLKRFLTIPVFNGAEIVAVVGVANKKAEYGEADVLQLTLLMDAVWKVVERRRAEESLRRIEWMLEPSRRAEGGSVEADVLEADFGGLVALNTCRTILDAVGLETLETIVRDSVDLLETSASVHEINGDYALRIKESAWCRLFDRTLLCPPPADSVRELMASGNWICHEMSWTQSAKIAIETGAPVDTVCDAGLNLYAVPIRAGKDIVGAVTVSYGDPPRDQATLREFADSLGLDIDDLTRCAQAYESRPAFIVEIAKKRVHASARLIGELVEHKRLEQEREALQGQLLQVRKLESVGRLAGGVAHDFNNMLGVILGYVEMALEKAPPSDTVHSELKEIQKAALRSAQLTRQLLAFARKQTIAPKVIDLNEHVEGTLNMLRRLIGEDVDLRWAPASGLWRLRIDPNQVDQILANLCVNARDAIDGVGRITIETNNSAIDEEYCNDHPGALPGDYVTLVISDNGCGIPREVLPNIFEPFFTTKPQGEGTGLGLATVYGIVKQNAGFINVYSENGVGTIFRIYLPRFDGEVRRTATPGESTAPRGRGESVLLVEDEEAIRNLGVRILERLDYSVIAAATPVQAIGLAEAAAGRIDLLITDVVMPEMNGQELATRIAAICPNLSTLFMSGYSANVIADRGILDESICFIQKPFSIQELATKAREALEKSRVRSSS